MTISKRVQKELVQATPSVAQVSERKHRSNKIKTTREAKVNREQIAAKTKGQAWTKEEHDRFLEALHVYPTGPWEAVAEYVGTKNSRQTMTHAQKYRQKFERQQRGLRMTNKQKARSTTAKAAARHAAAQPYPTTASTTARTPPPPVAVKLVDTLTMDLDSPRSVEEEHCPPVGGAIDTNLSVDLVDYADSKQLESVLEMFHDFDPLALQAHMWSTNSLMDNMPMESMALDELSALPEDFSQSLGLWVP